VARLAREGFDDEFGARPLPRQAATYAVAA
jgi:hypothetical protein